MRSSPRNDKASVGFRSAQPSNMRLKHSVTTRGRKAALSAVPLPLNVVLGPEPAVLGTHLARQHSPYQPHSSQPEKEGRANAGDEDEVDKAGEGVATMLSGSTGGAFRGSSFGGFGSGRSNGSSSSYMFLSRRFCRGGSSKFLQSKQKQ